MIGNKTTKLEARKIKQDYLFLLPQLMLYVGLTIIPFLVAIPILFTDRNNFSDSTVNFIGIQNFSAIFQDQGLKNVYWPALARTIRFTIANYAAVYLFGFTLALIMYEIGFKGGFFTVVYLPWMVSGLSMGFIALMLFSPDTGTVNLLLQKIGFPWEAINIRQPWGTTILLPLLIGWQAAGFNMAIFLSGLLAIPQETIEAAIVDGASYWQRLVKVYFPQMIPSFLMATIFCLIGSFGVFDQLVALGGLAGNEAATFVSVLVVRYGFQLDRLALGMTLAIETSIPLIGLAIFIQRLQRRLQY